MKTLIVYSSSRGTTEKAAGLLKGYLTGDIEVVNLRKNSNPDLSNYEAIIIGGSIHAGTFQGKAKKFMEKNLNLLVKKKIGLFICCMREGDEAKEQFENAFPKELKDMATAKGVFGGEFIFSKMNFLEKLIVKKVSGITEDTSRFDKDKIKEFANVFNPKINS